MLVDASFTEKIKHINADGEFIEVLSQAYSRFCKEIMIELTLFSFEPSDFGFSGLNLFSKEYAIQKYFELRLETYIRKFLFIKVFEDALEKKGYMVYTPTYYVPDDEYIDGEIFCTNKKYEEGAGFEIVIRTDNNELIGCRFTDILAPYANEMFENGFITSIIIIDWDNKHVISDQEKFRRTYRVKCPIEILNIKTFVSRFFGKAEGEVYEEFMYEVLRKYQETIGISSLPKLTAPKLFEQRLEVERYVLKTTVEKMRYSTKNGNDQSSTPQAGKDKRDCRYVVIDYNNFKTETEKKFCNGIENNSISLFASTGILDFLFENKLYKALVGKSDFAKSFMTSEYLYSQYNENDLFDYTSIVSGYLKSIEQLLYTIVLKTIDKGYWIKSNGKRKSDGSFPFPSKKSGKVYLIEFTSENLDYVDTTIGSLIHYLRDYGHGFMSVNSIERGIIANCLECYRIECRNESFHLHNNYSWSRVMTIRNNTILLYIMLLGSFNLGSKKDLLETYEIIEDDRLEQIYYWLRKKEMYTFRIKPKDSNIYYLAVRHAEEAFPIIDKNGLLEDDFSIYLKCYIEKDVSKIEYELTINRENIPDEIWYTNMFESYPIDFDL